MDRDVEEIRQGIRQGIRAQWRLLTWTLRVGAGLLIVVVILPYSRDRRLQSSTSRCFRAPRIVA
jgi:hypothetical protein